MKLRIDECWVGVNRVMVHFDFRCEPIDGAALLMGSTHSVSFDLMD